MIAFLAGILLGWGSMAVWALYRPRQRTWYDDPAEGIQPPDMRTERLAEWHDDAHAVADDIVRWRGVPSNSFSTLLANVQTVDTAGGKH